jgi:hypothetical protein
MAAQKMMAGNAVPGKRGGAVRNRYYLLTLYLICAATIGGCGLARNQIVATHSFGDATAELGAFGEREFASIRQGIIEMNTALLALDNTKTTANLVLDAPTGVEAVSKRTAAARVLKNYGELLQALASADPAERVRKPARALADSVDESLGGDWTDEQREAVQELAVGASSYFLAKKKADALKRIVPSYEKPVDALAGLLERDFSLDHDGLQRAHENVARRLKTASIRVINSGSRYSLSDRETAARALRTAEAALSRATELDRRFSAAVRALRKANRQLVEAMAKREYSWDEIRNYAKQLRELADAYQVLAE